MSYFIKREPCGCLEFQGNVPAYFLGDPMYFQDSSGNTYKNEHTYEIAEPMMELCLQHKKEVELSVQKK